jgi:hypothetical protein
MHPVVCSATGFRHNIHFRRILPVPAHAGEGRLAQEIAGTPRENRPKCFEADLACGRLGRNRSSPKHEQTISYTIRTCSVRSVPPVSLGEHVRQHNRGGGPKRVGLTGKA